MVTSVRTKIYEPAEDSFLLSKVLKEKTRDKRLKILEIGVGSGFQLRTLNELGVSKENLFGIDINKNAVDKCNKDGFNCILSDLFSNLENSKFPKKFDLIIFNPPYLPENSDEPEGSKTATTGGKKGSEIMNKFLKESKKYLEKNGKILLLTSSLTKGIKWNGFEKTLLEKEKLFFEELYVWELNL